MTSRLDGRCILIAEDNVRIAELLAELIHIHGGTVAGPVSCEEEAWKLLEEKTLDAAILDVRIRGKTSFTLADKLLSRRVPVIFTTGYAKADIPSTYSLLPVFTKPFRLEALIDCVAAECRTGPQGIPHS